MGDGCRHVYFAGGYGRSTPPDFFWGGDQHIFRVKENVSRSPLNFKTNGN
jgi:hypothetical protein